MVALRNTPVRTEVRQWWDAVTANQPLFLRIVALDSVVSIRFENLDCVIAELEAEAQSLQSMAYPDVASKIREHLLHSIDHLIASLQNLNDRQLFECDLRFNIAQVDMNLVQHALLDFQIVA